jgi:hypothetical protein
VRSNISRSGEALGRVNASPVGESHNHPDTGNGHQSAADRVPPRQLLAEAIEPFELFEQCSADPQHGLGDGEQDAVVRNEFQHPRLELPPSYDTDAQTEDLQRPTHRVLKIHCLGQKLLTVNQQHAGPLRFLAFNVDLPKPAKTNQLRDATRIIAVRLVPHGAQSGFHVAAFEADRGIPC